MSRPDHVATAEQEIRDAVMQALGNPLASTLLFEHREAERLCARKVHAALTKLCARVAADVRREVYEAESPSDPMDVTSGHCPPNADCLREHRGAWCGVCHHHYDPDREAEHDATCQPCEECS